MSKTSGKGRGGMALRGGIPELMRQANRMQSKLESARQEVKNQTWSVEAGGGKIKVTINGAREVTEFQIDKEIVNPEDIATLQDMVISAVNAAMKLVDEKVEAVTNEVTGGMKIPGMF